MNILKMHLPFSILLISLSAWSLESYQGADYPVESWRCGAPLVEALRKHDPDQLLNDKAGKLQLKESLEQISESNLEKIRKRLGVLSEKEKALVALIADRFHPPIVHRTSVDSSKFIVTSKTGMVSATKRKAPPKTTPLIEEKIFAAHDCIFTSVASPYGIKDYGNVILRFKDKKGFGWGSMYTGYRWTLEVEKKSLAEDPTDGARRRFATQIFTNNHWDEALALFIIENVRSGGSFRGKGASYDKHQILSKLLSQTSNSKFWSLVVHHRLAFLEGHYTDNVPLEDLSFVQYRSMDRTTISKWGLPEAWFESHDSFVQFFDRVD